MRIDDENKVVVPDFVAEWIEYNLNARVDLQIMVGCYASFLNRNDDAKTDGEKAVEWFVKNPYEFVRAYVEGYSIKIDEPDKKYYWRKKKEYLASFEYEEKNNFIALRKSDMRIFLLDNDEDYLYQTKFTETETRDLLKDDFDKFEKVECE